MKYLIMKKEISKSGLVKKMREIRDTLSNEIIEMSFEQENDFIKNQLIELKKKRKITLG